MVGWEAAAVMLEAVYTAMCSMLPTVAKERKAPRVVVVSYKRTVCQSSDNKKITIMGITILERPKAEVGTQEQ